jgi:putative flippase GtrA
VADITSGAPLAKAPNRPTSFLRRRGRGPDGQLSARLARWVRLIRFGLVGAAGLIVNELALAIAVNGAGLPEWIGPIVATQCSTAFAFTLIECWAFRSAVRARPLSYRFALFWMVNNVALLGRSPIILGLSAGLGMDILWSNLISLGVLTLLRFFIADSLIWGNPSTAKAADALGPLLGSELPLATESGVAESELIESDRSAIEVGRPVRDVLVHRGHSAPGSAPMHPTSTRRVRAPLDPGRAWLTVPHLALAGIVAVAMFVRVWAINAVGYNSDEIVYVSQGASIAGDSAFNGVFPIFRAHPLLFQSLLAVLHQVTAATVVPRLASAAFGLASVLLVHAIGRRLYGSTAGLIAAGILALMPYHVIVSRQVLLDGPMVCFLLVAMYALVRFAETGHSSWLYATSAGLGMSFLTKETAIVSLGIVAIFFALTPTIRVRLRHAIGATALFGVLMVVFPLAIKTADATNNRGQNFLTWQLARRPNHTLGFYFQVIPPAIGWVVIGLALFGLVVSRGHPTWRDVLVGSWVLVPFVFFELWPVKGFQYLLPLAPAVALLAGRGAAELARWPGFRSRRALRVAVLPIVLVALTASLAVPTWHALNPSKSGTLMAGAGGLPGGREAGTWIDDHVPEGAELLALGPSLANVIEYYGHRRAYGLSVSTNPLHRNPVYVPLANPDRAMREGQIQYLVWDSYTAGRSPFYAASLLRYVHRFHGTAVHVTRVDANDPSSRPVIIVYELRP